jgi:hypothetical protein
VLTRSLIKLDNVNVTFLDNTNLRGYDGADMATLGKYGVMTRMGMIEHCNSRNFDDVDGILGFGWADQPRSAALLKTLTQADRPSWNMFDQPFRGDHAPMPRKFTFTANYEVGELQLGGYDPQMLAADFTIFDMVGENVYGIPIHSITYGGVELLHFDDQNHKKVFYIYIYTYIYIYMYVYIYIYSYIHTYIHTYTYTYTYTQMCRLTKRTTRRGVHRRV